MFVKKNIGRVGASFHRGTHFSQRAMFSNEDRLGEGKLTWKRFSRMYDIRVSSSPSPFC